MRVGQAKELFRALTQQYFGGANVVFANQSRTAKQKEPLVVLTPGNVHRPQAPNYTFVDGEVVGHYLSRFSIMVDLFTNGSPVVDEVSGKVVAYEDNAVDDTRAYHVSQGLRVHLRRLRCRQGGGRERNAGPIRDGSRCKVNTEAESKKRHGRCSRRSHRARNNSPPMRAADSAAMNEVFTPVYECQYITKE